MFSLKVAKEIFGTYDELGKTSKRKHNVSNATSCSRPNTRRLFYNRLSQIVETKPKDLDIEFVYDNDDYIQLYESL